MNYTLMDTITIDRPIIFLCGPFYKKASSDRRFILQEFISKNFSNKYLPLVIDDFLTEENINDDSISIQLMEEICAAVSAKTYIFLDTMSTATELGIFANSSFSNKITVFIPKNEDIFNRGNVGYFVRTVALDKQSKKVETIQYRPKIIRKVIATDFVTEHYSFVGDKVPKNIISAIQNDPIFKISEKHKIYIEDSADDTDEPYKVRFTNNNDRLVIHVSVQLLFYVAVSVIHCLYKHVLNNKERDFRKFDIDIIEAHVKHAFKELIASTFLYSFDDNKDVVISTILKQESKTIIYHITKFVHVYYLFSSFDKVHLMLDPINRVLQQGNQLKRLNQIFQLSQHDVKQLHEVATNKGLYYEEVLIRKGRKTRKIIKYKECLNDLVNSSHSKKNIARELHENMAAQLIRYYTPNASSYAYQKNKNIKRCVMEHIMSKGFIKYDIKSFFNSITKDRTRDAFIKALSISPNQSDNLEIVLDSCFWNDELPLGLVLSPLISDVYLHDFDLEISKEARAHGFIYTRYADDIMISRVDGFSEEQFSKVDQLIKRELKKSGLLVNEKKVQRFNFDERHSFIKYLGINIINCEKGNYISVGNRYIYDTAKEYLNYDIMRKDYAMRSKQMEKTEKRRLKKKLSYKSMEIKGKIGYIKQIEGAHGINVLIKRLRKHYPQIDLNTIYKVLSLHASPTKKVPALLTYLK